MNSVIKISGSTIILVTGMALLAGGAASAQAINVGDINTGYFGNVAIKGYDPVAYFTAGKPQLGDPAISTNWLGAEWHFASEQDRELFIANPIAYAPQYGGHCADGMAYVATAVTVNIDPTAWRVIDGKLYLNYDPGSAADLADTKGLVDKADANWKQYQASHEAK
ncbi:MAG: hypothetical protein J0H54_10990 [Rhizobiales bacterium]|nr:hypothetical protein [Hyphomicrobiales bacterium]